MPGTISLVISCFLLILLQLLLVALITMTVFFRSTMHHNTIDDGILYLGALYFAIVMILFNGFTEVALLVTKLPVLYKHRDLHFYPSWAYTLPSWLLSIPTSVIESAMWVLVTYYAVGYDPQFSRYLFAFWYSFSSLNITKGPCALIRQAINQLLFFTCRVLKGY